MQVDSDVIRWVARDKALPMYHESSTCGAGGETASDATASTTSPRLSLLQMDGAGLEARASTTVKLLAGKSFNLAVTGDDRSAHYECGRVPERTSLGSKLDVDDKAMNISAGGVRLQVKSGLSLLPEVWIMMRTRMDPYFRGYFTRIPNDNRIP